MPISLLESGESAALTEKGWPTVEIHPENPGQQEVLRRQKDIIAMKSEWKFPFRAKGFRMDKTKTFRCSLHSQDATSQYDGTEIIVRVIPSFTDKGLPSESQSGLMEIQLPFDDDNAKELAQHCAWVLSQHLTYQLGEIIVFPSAYLKKMVPETEEEERFVADKPYSAGMHLVEHMSAPIFSGESFQSTATSPRQLQLIAQFNETSNSNSPIVLFLGYFRIVESVVLTGNPKGNLKAAMKCNKELKAWPGRGSNFEKFVDKIVEARHRCAHLKLDNEFGYTPTDSRIHTELNPLIPALEDMARYCIKVS